MEYNCYNYIIIIILGLLTDTEFTQRNKLRVPLSSPFSEVTSTPARDRVLAVASVDGGDQVLCLSTASGR